VNNTLIDEFYKLCNNITIKEKRGNYRVQPLINQIKYILIKLQLTSKNKIQQEKDSYV